MTALFRTAPWLALAFTLAASPALAGSGPPPGYILTDNADLAFTSPDGATKLEQLDENLGALAVPVPPDLQAKLEALFPATPAES